MKKVKENTKILHEYKLGIQVDNGYPFVLYVDRESTGNCYSAIEYAKEDVKRLGQELESDYIEKDFLDHMCRDLEKTFSDLNLIFFSTVNSKKGGNIELQIHKADVSETSNDPAIDWGKTIWITNCHSIPINQLIDFGFSFYGAKILTEIISSYISKVTLVCKNKKLYKFKNGKQIN